MTDTPRTPESERPSMPDLMREHQFLAERFRLSVRAYFPDAPLVDTLGQVRASLWFDPGNTLKSMHDLYRVSTCFMAIENLAGIRLINPSFILSACMFPERIDLTFGYQGRVAVTLPCKFLPSPEHLGESPEHLVDPEAYTNVPETVYHSVSYRMPPRTITKLDAVLRFISATGCYKSSPPSVATPRPKQGQMP